jgi:HNH endonuclease
MSQHSQLLSGLNESDLRDLKQRLFDRQSRKCFICDDELDLVVHADQMDVDHVEPLAEGGSDTENNLALVHSHCNKQKSASDLRVARRMAEFERLQDEARRQGSRAANLGHVLARYGGAAALTRMKIEANNISFAFPAAQDPGLKTVPIYKDQLSGMDYCFAIVPMEHLHHDDRINPRGIGGNIRGLIEEFMKRRPQLHVGLAWWAPDAEGQGPIKLFDGQHKAAAQILLGVRKLPVRIFLKPDTNLLLQTNTNAGDKLRQVAFDTAVIRHLGSTLYAERIHQYQKMKGLPEDNYEFSEKDLVTFFRGEHREVLRYVVDSVRDSVTYNKDNKLMEFVEWSGKGSDKPLSYATIERTFFAEFLYKKALETPIGHGLEAGTNPRQLEKEQLVRLMNLFAKILLVGSWDPEVGGRRLEASVQRGEAIPESHLRAWRISREEIFGNVMQWVRVVVEQYYAWTGRYVEKEKLFQYQVSDDLWARVEAFARNLCALPCWVDKSLSTTVFGAKQNRDYWRTVFQSGKTPTGVRVLAKPIDINEMIKASGVT